VKALCFEIFGGAEVLLYKELPDPIIGEGEVLVRMKAIGLNFADIYRRRGNYHLKGNPPYVLGYEGAGTVEQVGNGVTAGDPQWIDPRMLMDGSKTLTGGDLWNYITSHAERVTRANELFEWLRTKQLLLAAPTLYKLSEGAESHRYLESRHSTGKILLIP
jgi:NADPH:quinone reductase-like Zn-dependent oxidoreductase